MSSVGIFFLVFGIVLIIVMTIYHYIMEDDLWFVDADDFMDFMLYDYGLLVLLGLIALGGIIFGFIFWNWKIMLIITCAIAIIAIFILVTILIIKHVKKEEEYCEEDYDSIENDKMTTCYKCKNCGANISKIIKNNKIIYFCDYCKVSYTKKELLNLSKNDKDDDKYSDIELTDFEEEYFKNSQIMFLKPTSFHSSKVIDRKYDNLVDRIYNDEVLYNVSDEDQEDILDSAYDFFDEFEEEIEDYHKNTDVNEIKRRYEYFLLINEEDYKNK